MYQLSVNELYNPKLQQSVPLPEHLWKERHFYTFYLPFLRLAKRQTSQNPRWSVCISPEAEADVLTGLLNRLEAVCLRTLIVEIQFCKAGEYWETAIPRNNMDSLWKGIFGTGIR